jgi:hypothetical protein
MPTISKKADTPKVVVQNVEQHSDFPEFNATTKCECCYISFITERSKQ